jgi:hypothetical protein
LLAKKLAKSGKYHGIVTLGAVIPQWWQFSYLLENYHCYLYQI